MQQPPPNKEDIAACLPGLYCLLAAALLPRLGGGIAECTWVLLMHGLWLTGLAVLPTMLVGRRIRVALVGAAWLSLLSHLSALVPNLRLPPAAIVTAASLSAASLAILWLRFGRWTSAAGLVTPPGLWTATAASWAAWHLLLPVAVCVGFWVFLKQPVPKHIRINSHPQVGVLVFLLAWVPPILLAIATLRTRTACKRFGYCGNCGFDLVGLPQPVCPECGLPFEGSFPTRLVPTRAAARSAERVIPVWVAAVVLCTSVAYQVPDNGLENRKPLWLLKRDALLLAEPGQEPAMDRFFSDVDLTPGVPVPRSERPGASAAQTELLRRIASGGCDSRQLVELAAIALRVQEDQSRRMGQWAEIFDAAYATKAVPQDYLRRFFQGSLRFGLRARQRVAVGDPLPLEVFAQWRGVPKSSRSLPSMTELTQSIQLRMTSLTLDGLELQPSPRTRRLAFSSGFEYCTWGFSRAALEPEPMPRVTQTGLGAIRARVHVTWSDAHLAWPSADNLASGGIPAEWDVELEGSTTIVGTGVPTVTLDADAAAIDDLRNNYRLEIVQHFDGRFWLSAWSPNGRTSRLTPDLALDLFVVIDGEPLPLGPLFVNRGDFRTPDTAPLSTSVQERLERTLTVARTVTVLVRAAPDLATRTIDLETVWSGPDLKLEIALDSLRRRLGERRSPPPDGSYLNELPESKQD